MRVAALIIGICGVVVGGFFIAAALFLHELIAPFIGRAAPDEIAILGGGGIAVSIIALIGAVLAINKPRTSAALMAISAIAALILSSGAYLFGSILLLIAAVLAFLGRTKR